MVATIPIPGRRQRLIAVIAAWLLAAVIVASVNSLHGTDIRVVVILAVSIAAIAIAMAGNRMRVVLSDDYLTRFGYVRRFDIARTDIVEAECHAPQWTVSPVGCGAREALILELRDGSRFLVMRRTVLSARFGASEDSVSLARAINTWLER